MASMPQQSLAKRFHAVGLKPEEYMPLVRLIHFWTDHSGEEWTVRRLKDLRQLYLHRYTGLPYTPETRIALSSDGVPKGPFRRVFFMKGKRAFAQAWNALMVYTSFVSAKVTPSQAKKFLGGVRRNEPNAEALRSAMDLVALGIASKTHSSVIPPPPAPAGESLLDFVPRAGKERHTLDWVRTSEYRSLLYEAEQLLKAIGAFSDFPDIVRATLGCVMRPRDEFNLQNWRGAPRPVIGHVSAVQEPGYKARFIASPFPAVQQMMKPLHSWLAKVNQLLEGNWQFDQSAGLGWVRDNLSAYRYSCSVDLSGATDHFPLKLQTLALRMLGADEQWVSAVETFSHAMWKTAGLQETFTKVENSPNPLYWIRWLVGQPLGLIFSFNLFSLTHWSLCFGIQLQTLGPGQPLFAIVGDDVVWFNPDCAKRYMQVLRDLDCPYSESKTIESGRVAEFLSRIIETSRVVPSYKWKEPSDDSFIDIARCLGSRSLPLFKPRQRAVLRSISELPEPYGLGWNPKGIPYWDRFSKVPDEPLTLKEFRPVSASHHLSKIFYTEERLRGYLEELNISFQESDDQSLYTVLTKVFGRIASSEVLRDSLIRDFLSLSSLLEDEFRKFGLIRPEAIKLLPTELKVSLGVGTKPNSAQAAGLAQLISEFRKAGKVYAESPERSTTLERYERSLLKAAITCRGLEIRDPGGPGK